MLIQADASTKGWKATWSGISTGKMWSAQEMKYHINILELLAVKLAIQTFIKYRDVKAINLQIDNIVALTYLMKMGGTRNRTLQLVVLTVTGLDRRRREFQRQLPTLSQSQDDQIVMQSGLAGVIEGKLIHFLVM